MMIIMIMEFDFFGSLGERGEGWLVVVLLFGSGGVDGSRDGAEEARVTDSVERALSNNGLICRADRGD
jgi:hypothetical protein